MSLSAVPTPMAVGSQREQVFHRWWGAYHDDVVAYARRRGPSAAADDVAAATFAVLWHRIDNPPADPLPWLYAVARRQLANSRRGEARRLALVGRLSGRLRSAGADVAPDPAGTALDRAHARAALRRLRPADRELLMLVAWEGLDPSRAAAALDISEATFAVRLHRARRRLEALLTPDPNPPAGPSDRDPHDGRPSTKDLP